MRQQFDRLPISKTTPGLYRQLDRMLFSICNQFKLTKTQRERAEEAYRIIGDIIRNAPQDSILHEVKLRLYAQGSLLTGTAIRPVKGEEFDLDVVIVFYVEHEEVNPQAIQDEIYKLLKSNKNYSDIVERMPRCIRINYKEAFHIDLMPACPEFLEYESNGILVPYKKTKNLFIWYPSNPLDLGEWFSQMDQKSREYYQLMEKCLRNDVELDIDPFPVDPTISHLIAIVMLLKRARDVYFIDDPESSKIARSICLLVLSGTHYKATGSLISDLESVLKSIDRVTSDRNDLHVYNPLHLDRHEEFREDFAEKWRQYPGRYKKFRRWLKDLQQDLYDLKTIGAKKPHDYAEALKKLFGVKPIDEIFNSFGQNVTSDQKKGKLYLNGAAQGATTMLASSNVNGGQVPRNENFGGNLPRRFKSKKHRELPLQGQIQIMSTICPRFIKEYDFKIKEVIWEGEVTPSPISETYRIQIKYRRGFWPRVSVLSHDIGENCIHTYPKKELCLYHISRDINGWNKSRPIATTIVSWALLWLLHWENWKVTGKWNGEEFPHNLAV